MGIGQQNQGQPGIVGTVREFSGAVLAAVRTRLRILNLEIQEEKLRLAELVVLGVLFLLFMLMAFILIIFFLILLWPQQAEWIALGFAIFFVGGSFILYGIIYHKLKHGPSPFDQSIAELKKDIESLTGRDD